MFLIIFNWTKTILQFFLENIIEEISSKLFVADGLWLAADFLWLLINFQRAPAVYFFTIKEKPLF